MNTKITYYYKEKTPTSVVFVGEATQDDIEDIIDSLQTEEGHFIPEQVGYPINRPDESEEERHCYCTLKREDIVLTDEEPTLFNNKAESIFWAANDFNVQGECGWRPEEFGYPEDLIDIICPIE